MNSLKNIIKKYGFVVKKYKRLGKVHILDTDKGVYCLKRKENKNIDNIHHYLKSKHFNNILDFKSDEEDEFEITRYVSNVSILNEEKAMEAIYLMSMLHNRTTFYKSISLDEVKCFYEEFLDRINDIRNYYDNVCYMVDENLFMSPSQYLLVRNISLIYISLDYSKKFIDKWYDIMKDKSSKRVVMNHNNLELSHVLIDENPYLINWNKASFDTPVMDLYSFFRNNFLYINIDSLFNVYISKYQLLKEEYFLLFSFLLVPSKLNFNNSEIENTKNIYDCYIYLSNIREFISRNNLKENKEKCY